MLINHVPKRFSLFPDASAGRPDDTVLLFQGDTVLLGVFAGAGRLPTRAQAGPAIAAVELMHAFTQDGRRVFLADAAADFAVPDGFAFTSVRAFRTLQPAQDGFLLNAAYHLAVWYRAHRYCGACGGPTAPAEHERALVCQKCGRIEYPTIAPAVIVAILDGDRILLARNAHGTFRHFSLISGYVEVGETIEQTVHRETMEEVGLRLTDVRYIASQPWGLSQSLMLGFQARLLGSDRITLQESELAEAHWYTREQLPEQGGTASVAFDLIDRFRRGKLK